MTVAADGPHRLQHGGKTYLFCSAGCRARFSANPVGFLEQPAAMHEHHDAHHEPGACPPHEDSSAHAGAEATRFTCPMHPEVDEPRAGACPSCGMALEPRVVSAGGDDDGELSAMTRRLVVSALLTAPLIILPFSPAAGYPWFGWLQLALASPVVLWGPRPSSSAAGLRSPTAA